MVPAWAVVMSMRARMRSHGSRMWSAALQPGSASAVWLANLALAGATAHEGSAGAKRITASRLARAAAASDTSGTHASASGHAYTSATASCTHHPRGTLHVAHATSARVTVSLWLQVLVLVLARHAGTAAGTCRRVAKRGPAARRCDAMVYHWSTGAARGGPREVRRRVQRSLPTIRFLSAAHPTTFRRRCQHAAPSTVPAAALPATS